MAGETCRSHWCWCRVRRSSFLCLCLELNTLSLTFHSGLIAYRELAKDGFDVHVFERDNLPGGNWHYTEEIPLDAPVPNADIVVADYEPSLPPDGVELPYTEVQRDRAQAAFDRRAHRSPKPVWYSLKTNAPAVRFRCLGPTLLILTISRLPHSSPLNR